MRKVYVRFQPRWMTRFLFNLSPKVYEATDSIDDARHHLREIKSAIIASHLIGENSRLHLTEDDDSITILSSKRRMFLRFYIQHNYNNTIYDR